MNYMKVIHGVTAQFHLYENVHEIILQAYKYAVNCIFIPLQKSHMLLVLSDKSKFDSDKASRAVAASENALKYAFAHCACCACTAYPFWGHGKTWLPPLLNIDVLGGLRWVNKSWNTDNTTFKEMESMRTFAMCDAGMLRQEWERRRGMHANIGNRIKAGGHKRM